MRINSKGQVTIPADLRHKLGFHTGDVVDITASGVVIEITKREGAPTRGQRAVEHMRGSATTHLSTDELMASLRNENDVA